MVSACVHKLPQCRRVDQRLSSDPHNEAFPLRDGAQGLAPHAKPGGGGLDGQQLRNHLLSP